MHTPLGPAAPETTARSPRKGDHVDVAGALKRHTRPFAGNRWPELAQVPIYVNPEQSMPSRTRAPATKTRCTLAKGRSAAPARPTHGVRRDTEAVPCSPVQLCVQGYIKSSRVSPRALLDLRGAPTPPGQVTKVDLHWCAPCGRYAPHLCAAHIAALHETSFWDFRSILRLMARSWYEVKTPLVLLLRFVAASSLCMRCTVFPYGAARRCAAKQQTWLPSNEACFTHHRLAHEDAARHGASRCA